jgi:ferredoxin-type protein NapH
MKKRRGLTRARHAVQCGVLLLFLTLAFLGFAANVEPGSALYDYLGFASTWVMGEGVFFGTLSSSSFPPLSIVLVDPYAALEVMIASRSAIPALLIGAGIVILFYGLIKGRVFCGWACPLGLISEISSWIGRVTGLNKREALIRTMPRYSKIIIAMLVLLLSGVTGLPVYEMISPVATPIKLAVMGVWLGGWLFFAVIIIDLFFSDHTWCKRLCPLGGFYEAIGPAGIARVRISEGCIACGDCKRVCMADERILDKVIAGEQRDIIDGDCTLCGRCIEVCPKRVLHFAGGLPFVAAKNKGQADGGSS